MRILFRISVTEYAEVERLMKFYRDLGYECERDPSSYHGSWGINVGIKENGKYAF